MTTILALDTSAGACSVALQIGLQVLTRVEMAQRQHTLHILPMVDHVLAEAGATLADLDAIAYGAGPGSFTGLRIACGIAQGLAYGANLPVVPISSLAAMARRGFIEQPSANYCLACFDARMNQVYAGIYRNSDAPELLGELCVLEPEHLQLPKGVPNLLGFGSGMALLSRFPEQLQERLTTVDSAAEVLAEDVLSLAVSAFERGQAIDARDAEPIYLRKEINWKKTSEQ